MRVCVVGAGGVEFEGAGEEGMVPDGEADLGGEEWEDGEGLEGSGCAGLMWRTRQVRHGEVGETRQTRGPSWGRAGHEAVRGRWVRCVVGFWKSDYVNHVSFIDVVAALHPTGNLASCGFLM